MRAIFLDRDGVICENRTDHVKSWGEFRFLPGSLPALARLADTEFAKIVITNQAAINRGIVSAETVDGIHREMLGHVRRTGGHIDRVMVCPHRPDEDCACRKPRPGMLLQAAEEMGIDLSRSYLIGDATTDVQAGLAVGCQCFMVITGRGLQQSAAAMTNTEAEFRFARDLQHAIETILYLEAFGLDRPALEQSSRPPLARPLMVPALRGHAL